MPALIRAAAKGWGPDNKEPTTTDTVIPDNSYAPVYEKEGGERGGGPKILKIFLLQRKPRHWDPTTSGTVQNNRGDGAGKPKITGRTPPL